MSDVSPTEHIHEDILDRAREARDVDQFHSRTAAVGCLAAVSGRCPTTISRSPVVKQIQSNDQ